jgi:hypothetical protein
MESRCEIRREMVLPPTTCENDVRLRYNVRLSLDFRTVPMIYYLDDIRDPACEADERIKKRTPPRKRGPGRPPTDPASVAKVLLLQTYVHSSNRLAEGFLLLFREKLGIDQCHYLKKIIQLELIKYMYLASYYVR